MTENNKKKTTTTCLCIIHVQSKTTSGFLFLSVSLYCIELKRTYYSHHHHHIQQQSTNKHCRLDGCQSNSTGKNNLNEDITNKKFNYDYSRQQYNFLVIFFLYSTFVLSQWFLLLLFGRSFQSKSRLRRQNTHNNHMQNIVQKYCMLLV